MRLTAALLVGLGTAALTAATARAASPDATVSGAWMRYLTPAVPAGGYFDLRNTGATPEVLTGASSPACGMLMLHRTRDEAGMETMQAGGGVTVPPGGQVSFSPGGYHLMCMQPAAMTRGSTVPVTLQFGSGATLTAPFAVRGARG